MEQQDRTYLKQKQKIVVKIGTSTLSYANGRINLARIEQLAKILSGIVKKGKQLILVSSGAIGVGAGRIGMTKKPKKLAVKQALAAIGQAELMRIYQKFFDEHRQLVAQVLLTKDVMTDKEKHEHASNTLNKLLEMNIIPIINENDTISTDEIIFGDNDTLSAYVAALVKADLLVILSDIDGLYSADPRKDPQAKIISEVASITPEIEKLATGTDNSFGTGGMVTKIHAAKICDAAGIEAAIINGGDMRNLPDLLDGKNIGTIFQTTKK